MNSDKAGSVRLSDLLFCVDTNSLHLLKRLGQALHIVDIDFIIYESDTWTNPHYASESSGAEDRLEASGSALGHVDKVLITTCLGSRGLEKKIVVYISPENMGDFLAIVKEKNFIEVVSRSINQVGQPLSRNRSNNGVKVVIITVDDPKEGSLNPESVIDSIEVSQQAPGFSSQYLLFSECGEHGLAQPSPSPGRPQHLRSPRRHWHLQLRWIAQETEDQGTSEGDQTTIATISSHVNSSQDENIEK